MTHTADAAPQCSASVPVCTATTLGMVHVQGVQLVSVKSRKTWSSAMSQCADTGVH